MGTQEQIWKHWKFYLTPLQRRRWDFEFCNRYCIFLSLFSFLNLQIPWKKDLKSSRVVAFNKFSFKTWKSLPMHFLDRKWFRGPFLSNIVTTLKKSLIPKNMHLIWSQNYRVVSSILIKIKGAVFRPCEVQSFFGLFL